MSLFKRQTVSYVNPIPAGNDGPVDINQEGGGPSYYYEWSYLGPGDIVGIVVGVILSLALVWLVYCLIVVKRKRNKGTSKVPVPDFSNGNKRI